MVSRGEVRDYTIGSRRLRVLVVSATSYGRVYPVVVLVHDRDDGDVPGILIPLPAAAARSTCPASASPTRPRAATATASCPSP